MCDEAVTRSRSIASSAMLSAVSTPMVISDPARSLSMVEATPTTGKPRLGERQRPRLGPVAADHHQPVDPAGVELRQAAGAHRLVLELRQPRAPQEGAAALQDVAHVAGAQHVHLPITKTRVSVADTEDFPAFGDPGADDSADGGVHPGRVPTAGQNGDLSRTHRGEPYTTGTPPPAPCP